MRTVLFGAALSIASLATLSAQADETGPFAKWLNKDAPRCVPVSEFASVSHPIALTQEQFEFVRALYVALPPISRTLPPGDHALMATAGDETLLALVGDNVSCARFLAPDFIVAMLIQVGQGAYGQVGDPTAFTIYR